MTSSRDHTPVLRRTLVGLSGLVIVITLLALFSAGQAAHATTDAARQSLARSLALLSVGNPTAARTHAMAATREAPDWALAQAVLGRTLIDLGDGLGAEAALDRARDGGIDVRRIQHLRAAAILLQGDAARALSELDKADPRFARYALRIRARALAATGDNMAAADALDRAVALAPRDAGVWTDLGRFRRDIGDLAGAITASTRAVTLDPRQVDALLLRAQLVRDQYGLSASLPWFEAALARDPWHHDTLIDYAATLGEMGRTNAMLGIVRRAVEARPGSAQGLYLQAVLAARAGDYDTARSILQRAGPVAMTVPGGLLLGGALDLENGDIQQASEKLGQLVQMQPMNITARQLLAVALLRADAARNALDVLRPVALRGDADSYTLTLVARGFERIGDRTMASRFIDRAAWPMLGGSGVFATAESLDGLAGDAAIAPGDPGATVALVRGLIGAGDIGGALAKAQDAAAANPGAPEPQVMVGDTLMIAGRNGDAIAAYRRAAAMRFDEPILLRLVDALDRGGQRGEAAKVLALFLDQNPENIAAGRLAAHWQIAAGDFADAVVTLENLRGRIGDGDAVLHAELALAYAGIDDAPRAVAHGEAAYALSPTNPAVADAYGWALFVAGDTQGALPLLEKALAIAPGHPGLRAHLNQVQAALGR